MVRLLSRNRIRRGGFAKGKKWYGYYEVKTFNPETSREEWKTAAPITLGLRCQMTKFQARDALMTEIAKRTGNIPNPAKSIGWASVRNLERNSSKEGIGGGLCLTPVVLMRSLYSRPELPLQKRLRTKWLPRVPLCTDGFRGLCVLVRQMPSFRRGYLSG